MKKKSLGLIIILTMIISLAFSLSCITAFADDVIEVKTIEDLYNIQDNMSGNYKLMNDIDMSETSASGSIYNLNGQGWEPIGDNGFYQEGDAFTGTFDGNGHKLINLRINSTGRASQSGFRMYSALFSNNAGTIKNLYIQDCSIQAWGTGRSISQTYLPTVYAAGIAAKNSGTIKNCSFDGSCSAIGEGATNSSTVTYGTAYSAGISALNTGEISQCYNNGMISAQAQHSAHVTSSGSNCYGIANGGIISNCYNNGEVGGSYKTAYVIGTGTITCCYSTKAYDSGFKDKYIYYDASGSSHNLIEAQMQEEKWFEGFDFENTWIFDSGADYKYPQLRNCRQDLGRAIDTIELKSAPNRITYKTGDDFDPTGCVVTVFYKDNGSEDINVTEDMLSGYDMSTAGIQDVVFNYRGYSLSFKINVNQRPEITDMELTSEPLKTTFIRGTEFDFTGAVAQIRYKDNTTEDFLIDAKDCTGGEINTSGDYVITYSKFGYSVTFNVSVVPVREEGIHIESLPDKVSYIEGEEINTAGLAVYVDYNTGESAPIDDYTIADYDNSAGVQTITVQYKSFEATFEVSFAEKKVLSIEVTKQPDKTEYVFGQLFDPTGMIVTANLDNGKTEEVTDYVVSPMEDRNGMQDLTVSYAGKTTYVTVFVTQRALDSISVTTKPYKLTYIEGSEFDPEGMVVTAKYNDDSTEVITDYTMSKLGKTPGNKTIVISYNGKTTTLAVTVIAKTVVSLNVTAPNKVNYVKGEAFDPTGMVVTATYNDGTTAEVTDYRVAGFGETDEVNILEVSYGGKAESIVVTIHDPGAWEVIKAPTCTEAGQEGRKCKECGDVIETRATDAAGHSYGQWVVVKKASYTEAGQKERICAECDHKDKRAIPMLERTSISKATVSGVAAKVYTGKAIVQTPVVKLNGKTLKVNTDYTVAYKNNKNVGTATVTITGQDAYKGSVNKTFVINPKAATISKPTAISKGFTAKWKKQAVQTTGYELQYALNSKFTSGKKTVSIKKNTIVSKKVTNLKSKKKYFLRVRTFKTVSGKKYYSAWSKTTTVTTKK